MPKTLRNTIFTYMVGDQDTMYGRLERCRKFNAAIQALRGDRTDIYPVELKVVAGNGHTGLPDRDKIKDVYPHRRNSAPKQVTWELLDNVIDRSYWLGVPKPGSGQAVEAKIEDNKATVTTRKVEKLALYLDARLVRFDRPLAMTLNGKKQEVKIVPSLAALCRTMSQRGDPQLAYSCRVRLP